MLSQVTDRMWVMKNLGWFADIGEASKAGSHILLLPLKFLFLTLCTSTLGI